MTATSVGAPAVAEVDPGSPAPGTARRRRFGAIRDVGAGVTAVGVKELRGRMRGRRAFVILTIYLLLLAGFAWMWELVQERQAGVGVQGAFFASAAIGRELFIALLMLETLLVVFLAPSFTAGAISMEREKQTLDMLATTPISSLAIVIGKLLSALVYVFLLLLASIPLTAIVFTFGGISPDDLVRGYLVLIVTTIGLGSIGLFASALVKRTQAATVITYFTVLALTLGATFVFIFWATMTGWQSGGRSTGFVEALTRRPPEILMYLNPFAAQADVVCGTETGFGVYCDAVSRVTGRSVIGSTDFTGGAPNDVFGGAPNPLPFGLPHDTFWPRSMIAWLIVSAILIVLSVQLVTPTRRWRLRRPRRRGRSPEGAA